MITADDLDILDLIKETSLETTELEMEYHRRQIQGAETFETGWLIANMILTDIFKACGVEYQNDARLKVALVRTAKLIAVLELAVEDDAPSLAKVPDVSPV